MNRGGKLIKLAREARGMTQDEVAFAYGVSLKSIQRWESFKTEPKFNDVVGIITDICKMTLSTAEGLICENN
ncbi:MAG: helix-turn-helix transcriptional regulator [Alteromonadaceae bacterium]|nr:helix-turn-helix transcriptional regulator [Alteromonadaceae bacterium]